jgi:hypothetical protein
MYEVTIKLTNGEEITGQVDIPSIATGEPANGVEGESLLPIEIGVLVEGGAHLIRREHVVRIFVPTQPMPSV